MATYRIDVPTTGGTITAATFDTSCVNNVSIDLTHDPDQMIRSTGVTSDGKVTIDCYAMPSQASLRDWEFPLTYNSGSNSCSHTLHLYQQGSGGCTAGTYSYTLHVPQIPQPGVLTGSYDIYLCKTHQISNPLEAQSLARSGGTKLEKVSTYYSVCDFDVDSNGNFVRVSDISNKINFVPTGGGEVTTTDFEVNKGYYICAVQIDDPTKFYPFGTLADLKTQDVTCADDTQEVTN